MQKICPQSRIIQRMFLGCLLNFSNNKYSQSKEHLSELITYLCSQLSNANESDHVVRKQLRSYISIAYMNMSICTIHCNNSQKYQFQESCLYLEKSLRYNTYNYYSYYNLFSLYYKTHQFEQALKALTCGLSALYVLAAMLPKLDLKNRHHYLNKSISFCQNNIQAHLLNMNILLLQRKVKLANNSMQWALHLEKSSSTLQAITHLMTNILAFQSQPPHSAYNRSNGQSQPPHSAYNRSNGQSQNISHSQNYNALVHNIIKMTANLPVGDTEYMLECSLQIYELPSILDEIEGKVQEFNSLTNLLNDKLQIRSEQKLIFLKIVDQLSFHNKKTYIITNKPTTTKEQLKCMELQLNTQNNHIQDNLYDHSSNQGRNSQNGQGHSYKGQSIDHEGCLESHHQGQSIFELSKSNNRDQTLLNLQNSNKVVDSRLLSSFGLQNMLQKSNNYEEVQEVKTFSMKKKDLLELEGLDEDNLQRNMEIEVIESCIEHPQGAHTEHPLHQGAHTEHPLHSEIHYEQVLPEYSKINYKQNEESNHALNIIIQNHKNNADEQFLLESISHNNINKNSNENSNINKPCIMKNTNKYEGQQPTQHNNNALINLFKPNSLSKSSQLGETPKIKDKNESFNRSNTSNSTMIVPLYPLQECNKYLEIVVEKAEIKGIAEESSSLTNVYCKFQYIKGLADSSIFTSKTTSFTSIQPNLNSYEWNESIGVMKICEDAKNMTIKCYKKQNLMYNDFFIGEGEIQVTMIGHIIVPLYHLSRRIGFIAFNLNSSTEEAMSAKLSSYSLASRVSSSFSQF